MATNPLLRYGPPRQIACTLGISGEFPNYISGAAYTGTVAINGAQGATRVDLVPPGLDDVGTEYVPLRNAGFEAAGDWVVDPARSPAVAPGFSIETGTGRTGTGFLRWQGDPAGAQDKFNSLTVARTIASGRIDAAVWVRCTAHSGGGGSIQAGILIEQFADEAMTVPLGSAVSSFALYNGVDTNWRKVDSWTNNVAGYTRVSIIVTQGINTGLTATLEFDDVEWNARGIATGAPSTLGLPAGFTIDTVTSPDRVRVQWPEIPSGGGGGGTSTLANLDLESGDANWFKGYGWAITNVAPVDVGSWSAKYSGLGQSSLVHETLAPVTAGTSITASCRVSKGGNRQDFAGGAVLLEWLDANTRPLGFNVGNVVNTGSSAFQTSSVTATAPAGAAFVRLGASGTRDVKGRASDVVTVDTFVWNHTFALGGSGGSGGGATPVTGPVAFSFRVTDSQGCTTVATRTINGISGGEFTYRVSEASSSVSSFNVPLPVEAVAGDAILLLSITPTAGPGVYGYWNPTGGISLSAGQGQLSVGTVQHCVFVATASHIVSGVPCEVASNMGSPSRTGKFLAVRIPSAYVKTPIQFADGGANLFNGPFSVSFGWPAPSIGIGTFFNESGTTNTSYPLPFANSSITFNGIYYAVCLDVYAGSSPFTVSTWNVSPPGGFTLTQPSILRSL